MPASRRRGSRLCWESVIYCDWILIYAIEDDELVLYRTGSRLRSSFGPGVGQVANLLGRNLPNCATSGRNDDQGREVILNSSDNIIPELNY